MSGKIEISRELIERIVKDGAVSMAQIDQMRQTLAAPVVERQEPAAWLMMALGAGGEIYRKHTGATEPTLKDAKYCWGQGVIDRFTIVIKPLYASPPAPVSVALPQPKQSFPFGQLAAYREGWNACLDKVKELNS